jgi:hypothetical protein
MRQIMANQTKQRFARRPFLAGLGAAGAGMFLRPRIAEAQGMVPQRLVVIHRPEGSVLDAMNGCPYWWFPTAAGPTYELSPMLQSFAPVKANMLVIRGIDCPRNQPANGDKHAQGIIGMMSGVDAYMPPGTSQSDRDDPNSKAIRSFVPTIDQQVLAKIDALKGTPIPSIQLAGTRNSMPGNGNGFTCLQVMSYMGPAQTLPGEGRSASAFTTIFGTTMMGGMDPTVVARQAAQNKSVLDFVSSDLNRLRGRVPSSQYPKMDAHLDAIRQLEGAIMMPPSTGTIVKPTLVTEPTTGNPGASPDEAAHQMTIRNMLSIIRCAFQSDLTRVATITFADGNNVMAPKNFVPGASFNIDSDHHSVSHSGTSLDSLRAKGGAEKMYADEVAKMVIDMQNTPEGPPGETLLDHTLVVYINECSIGDDHHQQDMPILLIGGKFLKLHTNDFLKLSASRYMNDVWSSMLTAWGVPTTTWGDAKYSQGPIPGLFG